MAIFLHVASTGQQEEPILQRGTMERNQIVIVNATFTFSTDHVQPNLHGWGSCTSDQLFTGSPLVVPLKQCPPHCDATVALRQPCNEVSTP